VCNLDELRYRKLFAERFSYRKFFPWVRGRNTEQIQIHHNHLRLSKSESAKFSHFLIPSLRLRRRETFVSRHETALLFLTVENFPSTDSQTLPEMKGNRKLGRNDLKIIEKVEENVSRKKVKKLGLLIMLKVFLAISIFLPS
jgi:hypothetical protein